MDTTMDRGVLESKLLPELQQIAQTLGVEGTQKLRKAGLIDAIVAASTNGEGPAARNGDEAAGAVASVTPVGEAPARGRDDDRPEADDDDGPGAERGERTDGEDRADP